MRLLDAIAYLIFITIEIVKGSLQIARDAFTPGVDSTPAIVEFPLRCRTDLEVTALASSITITPGTLVLGTAASDGVAPPILYVHALYGSSKDDILTGLRDMERRLLRITRGRAAERGERA